MRILTTPVRSSGPAGQAQRLRPPAPLPAPLPARRAYRPEGRSYSSEKKWPFMDKPYLTTITDEFIITLTSFTLSSYRIIARDIHRNQVIIPPCPARIKQGFQQRKG